MIKRLIVFLLIPILVQGSVPPLRAQEKPVEGKVSLMIQPFGAEIRVDGEFLGKSPLESLLLPAGEHELRIRYEGYQEFSTRITVEAGKSIILRGHLQSISSTESPLPTITLPVRIPPALRNASHKRVYRLGALGLSGAALVSAGVFYYLGDRAGSDYSRAADNYQAARGVCQATLNCYQSADLVKYKGQADGAKSDFYAYRNGYYVSLGLTGLFLGVTGYLFIIQRSKPVPDRRFSLMPFSPANSSGAMEGIGISTNVRF
jgi:hypothetical protein